MQRTIAQITRLFIRADGDDSDEPIPQCSTESDFSGSYNLRILAIFMVMISSAIGVFFPILSSRYSFIRLPNWCWFIAKFFGSGVIIATGFIHLLEPAAEALENECLGGTFAEYPWAFGICLMSLFTVFFTEFVAHHYVSKANGFQDHVHSHFETSGSSSHDHSDDNSNDDVELKNPQETVESPIIKTSSRSQSHMIGNNHYSHDADHQDPETLLAHIPSKDPLDHQSYLNKLLSVFVLEFGILFHSVFIGLSLAVAGDEFNTLFIVIVFHQMFEGLGLGTRIAETPWDRTRRMTPWILATAFAFVTPVAIAIGIGVRHSFVPGSRKALISNGVFDAISAGILIYTGLVELMAHEFLYSNQFKGEDGLRKSLLAFFIMCWGAGLMALLGKWA